MASSREPLIVFSRRLDKTERQLELLLDLARKTNETVRSLRPQHEQQPIPRPKQKRDFNRSCNVVGWLRAEIDLRNASLPDNGGRYEQFPEDTDDTRISSGAQRCLEILVMFHLDTDYGQYTWDQEMVRKPRECAAILREARQTPELSVFCQTAGLWGIDMLLKSKMKSKLRNFARSETQDDEELAGIEPTHLDQPQNSWSTPMSSHTIGQNNATMKVRSHPALSADNNQYEVGRNAQNITMNTDTGMEHVMVSNGLSRDAAALATSLQRAANTTFTHQGSFQQPLSALHSNGSNGVSNLMQNVTPASVMGSGVTHPRNLQNPTAPIGNDVAQNNVTSNRNDEVVPNNDGRNGARRGIGRGFRGRVGRGGARRRVRARRN